MQGYLRNPLADPGLFGIAPGAALGAVASLWFGFAASPVLLPLFALLGAAGAMALLAAIAGRTGGIALFTLAGMMIASLAGALTSLAISLAPNAFAMSEIVTWLMGALTDRSWSDVALAAPLTLAGIACLLMAARGLDALVLGDAAARSLGMEPRALQGWLIAGVGMTVGSGVAVAGIVGFVGLIVPHLVRPFTDRRPSGLLLPSALAGALLVIVADSVVPRAAARHRAAPRYRAKPDRCAVLPLAPAADAEGAGMTLEALNLSLRGRLADVSATLEPGRITAICGPNGAGKSSLLQCLAGLLAPDAGCVALDGGDLARLHPRTRAQAIGYLPQDGEVAWDVAVRSLVALGRLPHRDRGTAEINAALLALDLEDLSDRPVSRLSGGERARALLARVLAGTPRWILADEPLAALDIAHQLRLLAHLRRAANGGAGVVLVLHDLALAMNHTDRVMMLDVGRKAADGTPEEALSADVIENVWGVPAVWLGEPGSRALAAGQTGIEAPGPFASRGSS